MYELHLSQMIRQQLDVLLQEGRLFGQGEALEQALLLLGQRSRYDPHEVGEIAYHLSSGFPLHFVAEAPLFLRFVIVDQARQVWVLWAGRLASRHE